MRGGRFKKVKGKNWQSVLVFGGVFWLFGLSRKERISSVVCHAKMVIDRLVMVDNVKVVSCCGTVMMSRLVMLELLSLLGRNQAHEVTHLCVSLLIGVPLGHDVSGGALGRASCGSIAAVVFLAGGEPAAVRVDARVALLITPHPQIVREGHAARLLPILLLESEMTRATLLFTFD